MNPSPIRPLFWFLDQAFSDRVLPNIAPLFGIALIAPQPMMENTRLKTTLLTLDPPKSVFPKASPLLNSKRQIVCRAEKVQMVRHQNVVADQPRCGFVLPDFMQCSLHARLCQPRESLFGAYCQQNPIGPTPCYPHSPGWGTAACIERRMARHEAGL
jgi:hypothetical protein